MSPLSPKVRMAVYVRDQGICGICGKPVALPEYHTDHVIPVSLGGSDDLDNLRCSHDKCNLARGNGHIRMSAPAGKLLCAIISVRLDPETYTELEEQAEIEGRTVSNLARLLIAEALRRRVQSALGQSQPDAQPAQ